MLLFVTMYAFLYVILVRATDGFDADVQSVREELGELFTGNFGSFEIQMRHTSLLHTAFQTKLQGPGCPTV